jgi:hypothetical protein
MKRSSYLVVAPTWAKKFLMLCTSIFVTLITFAQDKKIDVDINADKDGGGGFFASPVVWIIGVAVFILLLVALMRNNSGSRTDV